VKVWSFFIAFFIATFCSHATVSPKVLTVVTTFPILQDLTQQIVGDRPDIRVYSIVKGKADPHTYQPKTDDGKIVANAHLIITNGLGFEAGWMNRLITGSGSKAPVFIAAQSIKPRILTQPHRGDTVPDPHAWHNVQNTIAYARVILQALCTIDPEGRIHYEAQFAKLNASLTALDSWVKDQFARIPLEKRRVITTHDAFWYYGEAYGVEFLSPVGISTDAEPSAAAIAHLIDKIRSEGIVAVFIENLANPRQIEIISQEAGVSIHGMLYADTLSDSTGSAANYQDMIRHNTMMMVKAF
jgi:zinc/manganese transport system substrate-binding protein